MPSQPARSIVALALAARPDGRWSVSVAYDDDSIDATVHDSEPKARARLVEILEQVPVTA